MELTGNNEMITSRDLLKRKGIRRKGKGWNINGIGN